LSVLGNAEVHGGHLLVNNHSSSNTEFITLRDVHGEVHDVSLFSLEGDPNGIVIGTMGSLGLDHVDGYLWINVDDATQWNRLTAAGDIASVTLQQAYKFDTDGADATITTDPTDGAVVIAGNFSNINIVNVSDSKCCPSRSIGQNNFYIMCLYVPIVSYRISVPSLLNSIL
jgi:hypothetical protein